MSTYQIFADFDGFFKNGPNYRLIAVRSGKRAQISEVLGQVDSIDEVIHGDARDVCVGICTWRREQRY